MIFSALNLTPAWSDSLEEQLQKEIADLTREYDNQIQELNQSSSAESVQECEIKITNDFKTGVPTKYSEKYSEVLQRLSNKRITGEHKGDFCYVQPELANTQKITCKAKTSNSLVDTKLQDCENAAQTLPALAKFITREMAKNEECEYKSGRITDISVSCM